MVLCECLSLGGIPGAGFARSGWAAAGMLLLASVACAVADPSSTGAPAHFAKVPELRSQLDHAAQNARSSASSAIAMITDRAWANPQAMRAGLLRTSCSARALSTSKVSVPATTMADKLITSWIAEPMASLGTQ